MKLCVCDKCKYRWYVTTGLIFKKEVMICYHFANLNFVRGKRKNCTEAPFQTVNKNRDNKYFDKSIGCSWFEPRHKEPQEEGWRPSEDYHDDKLCEACGICTYGMVVNR